MSVQNILDRKGGDIASIRATATVKSAADLMRQKRIAALVVMSCEEITGIVTERDIVHALSRHGEDALAMPVKDVLTRVIITVTPEDSLRHALRLMTDYRVRHLPVIANGKLVGIVSIGDVVKHRLEDLETQSNVLRDVYIAAH